MAWKCSALLDSFGIKSAVFKKHFSRIRRGANAAFCFASDRTGKRTLVFFSVFMEHSFLYGSVKRICRSDSVESIGKSCMVSDLSLDCGSALCHTFFMVSSVSRESVR